MQGSEEMKLLHEMPVDHPARNTALVNLDVRIRCRHTRSMRDPRTWKIKSDTYNRLNDSWRNNFDFIVTTP
jgi:hypothetical protein